VHAALTANGLRDEFEAVYGILVVDQVLTNADYRAIIGGIASYMINTAGFLRSRTLN